MKMKQTQKYICPMPHKELSLFNDNAFILAHVIDFVSFVRITCFV